MGLLEFNKLPINTLVGADCKTFKAITAGREIHAAYKGCLVYTSIGTTDLEVVTDTFEGGALSSDRGCFPFAPVA